MKPFYALKIELLCFYEGCATATAVSGWRFLSLFSQFFKHIFCIFIIWV